MNLQNAIAVISESVSKDTLSEETVKAMDVVIFDKYRKVFNSLLNSDSPSNELRYKAFDWDFEVAEKEKRDKPFVWGYGLDALSYSGWKYLNVGGVTFYGTCGGGSIINYEAVFQNWENVKKHILNI